MLVFPFSIHALLYCAQRPFEVLHWCASPYGPEVKGRRGWDTVPRNQEGTNSSAEEGRLAWVTIKRAKSDSHRSVSYRRQVHVSPTVSMP